MTISKTRPFKLISILVLFTFMTVTVCGADTLGYVPFDESQDQSNYLTPEQLENFRESKNSLVDKHNAENAPPLTDEEDIIQFLYDLMAPSDLADLTVLQNNYLTAKSERETAQDEYGTLQEQLKDYYVEEENARLNLQNVITQIAVFTDRLADILEEKSETDEKLLALENAISVKKAAMRDGQLDDIAAVETELEDLRNYLSTLISQRNASAEEQALYEAELDLASAQEDFDDALALVRQNLGNDFDLETSDYDKIYDSESNLTGVRLTPRDLDNEAILLDALLKQIALNDASDLFDQLKDTYNNDHPLSGADGALNDYKALLSEIPTVEDDIGQKEIDLVSRDEAVRAAEIEINNLQSEIDITNSKYSLLAMTADALMDQIDSLNQTKIRLEEEERRALDLLKQMEEEIGFEEVGENYFSALEKEENYRSLYESALRERIKLLNALGKPDKNLQSSLLAAILEAYGVDINLQPEQEGQEIPYQSLPVTGEAINRLFFGDVNAVILVNGKITDVRANLESVKASLRKAYASVFNSEPGDYMLNAFADIITRAKMPAMRLFEILKRIDDRKLRAGEEKKLDSERDLADKEKNSILQTIKERLQQSALGSAVINSAMTYLGSPVVSMVTCGVMALGRLFKDAGKTFSQRAITEEAILTDIITGAINENTAGELHLSFYALQKAAGENGTALIGQEVDISDLGKIDSPFIAHVNGDHYVTVNGVAEDTISFFDPAFASSRTMNVESFSRSFTGNVLTLSGIPGARALSENEMKSILGAWSFRSISRSVSRSVSRVTSSVRSAVSKVSSSVSRAVSSVSISVKSAVSKVSSSVSRAVSSVSSSVKSAVSKVSSSVSRAVSSVSSSVKSAVSKVRSSVSRAVSSVSSSVKSAGSSISNAVSKVVDSVKNAVSSPAQPAASSAATTGLSPSGTAKSITAAPEATIPASAGTGPATSLPAISAGSSSPVTPAYRHGNVSISTPYSPMNSPVAILSSLVPGSGVTLHNESASCMAGTGPAAGNQVSQNNLTAGSMKTNLSKIFSFFKPATDTSNDHSFNANPFGPVYQRSYSSPPQNVDPGTAQQSSHDTRSYMSIYTVRDQMCVDENLQSVRMNSSAASYASPLFKGTAMGLLQGYSEAMSPSGMSLRLSFPGIIDSVNSPKGRISLRGLDLDFGGGKISPHDAPNVLSITRIDDPLRSSKGPTIVTKDLVSGIDDGEIQVLKALKDRGFKTSTIYYENVPAPPADRSRTFKLFNDILEDGGEIHVSPRTKSTIAIPKKGAVPESVYKKAFQQASKEADNIADDVATAVSGSVKNNGFQSFVPKKALSPKGGYNNVFSYTVKKAGATSADDAVSAAARSSTMAAAKGTAKSTASGALKAMRYAAVPLMIIGVAMDVIDLHNAYKKDQEEGGYRNTVTTSGRIAGAWGGGLAGAKIGAAAGAAVGVWFGGIGAAPGALIGAVAGGILGAIGGSLAGEYVAGEVYDAAEGGDLDRAAPQA